MSTADTDPHAMNDNDHGGEDSHGLGAHKASYDDINVPVLIVVGFVSAVLTFVTICGSQALYYHYQRSELVRKVYDAVRTPQSAITDEQQAKLNTFGHQLEQVDTDKGKAEVRRISIPLSEAVTATLEQERNAQEAAFPNSE